MARVFISLVQTNGARWWRWDYRRPSGKRNTLSLGVYPEVSLKKARERCQEARRALADGVDPGAQREAEKAAQSDTFESVAREWSDRFSPNWATTHSSKIITRLEKQCLPLDWHTAG